MERLQTFSRIVRISCVSFFILIPLSTYADRGLFHSELYAYKQEIIDQNQASNDGTVSSTTNLTGIRLTYDIGSHSSGNDLRLVDIGSQLVPYAILEHPQSSLWQNTTIIDHYTTPEKDLVIVDMGNKAKHSSVNIALHEEYEEGSVSLFSTAEYYGIDLSTWDVLGRNIPIFKNGTIVDYPESTNRYVMVVVRGVHATDTPSISKIFKKNADYNDGREQFYTEADRVENNNQTILNIDTKTTLIDHNRIDLTAYKELFVTEATIETSNDKNIWTNRGSDSIYKIIQENKKSDKTWLAYETNRDRFIRITIPETKLLIHRLVQVSGPARYLVYNYDPSNRYRLFYGNFHALPMVNDPSIEAKNDLFWQNPKEVKIGIIEENPQYMLKAQNGVNLDLNYFLQMIKFSPYTETGMLILISFFILIVVGKVLGMKTK